MLSIFLLFLKKYTKIKQNMLFLYKILKNIKKPEFGLNFVNI